MPVQYWQSRITTSTLCQKFYKGRLIDGAVGRPKEITGYDGWGNIENKNSFGTMTKTSGTIVQIL